MDGRSTATADPARLRAALAPLGDPERAAAMAEYMKGHFEFLGVPAPQRRAAQREWVTATAARGADHALAAATELWEEPEREFQYVGCDVLRKVEKRLGPHTLAPLRDLVTRKSWWDTVDSLAHVVGTVVRRHPEVAAEVQAWVRNDDIWVARVALLHQLGWKADADPQVVFRLCSARLDDPEFFVRKAIGWALRDLARTHAELVWSWVDAHPEMSGLSRREATKHRPRTD